MSIQIGIGNIYDLLERDISEIEYIRMMQADFAEAEKLEKVTVTTANGDEVKNDPDSQAT